MTARIRSSARGGPTTSCRRTCRAGNGHRRDRAALRALRLPPDRHAGVRGHRPLRPHVGLRLGCRAEGDVHLRDRSDRSLTLRPEGTAPICRAYVEHGMHREPQPVKLYTIAPMYRYGAPGRGRYREHWQASVEAIGTDDPAVDAELIQLYDTLLARPGVTRYHLELNSIGCRTCRPRTSSGSRAWLDATATGSTRRRGPRRASSPLRVFDNFLAKPDAVRAALDEAPKIGESLCDACVAHFAAVRATSTPWASAYGLVPTLVRGLDYYTRTTWEFIGPLESAELDDLGRRPLRLPDRGDRRTADAGRRLRRGHRAPRHRPRGRGSRRAAERRRSTCSSRSSDGRAARPGRRPGSPRCAARASPPRPTTRAARSRAS